jgi:hypothetical protein
MAFQTGTSTSIENLMTQLSTFVQANGWTEDYFNSGDPGTIAFSKNNIFVSWQFSETASGIGVMACYTADANDPADTLEPWTATGDSGSGINTTSVISYQNALNVNNFSGPHTNFWFFENNAAPAYVHIIVEVDAGRFRHFGFGELDKIGDWSGGEYTYGMSVFAGSQADDPNSVFNTYAMDSVESQSGGDRSAAMRLVDFVGEPSAATTWAQFHRAASNDRAGNPRYLLKGGHRYSPEFGAIWWIRFSEFNAFKPMSPISVTAIDFTGAPDSQRKLGFVADTRCVNIANVTPAQIITIAGDQWYFFPLVRKQRLQLNTEETFNFGLAYRRIDA